MNRTSKKLWLKIGLALVLVFGVALAIILITIPDSTTSLRPGGLITGVDGVSISAPQGALEHRIDIFIDPAEDPRLEVPFPSFLEGLGVVGNFYEITASEEYWSDEMDLIIGLPVPEGVSPDNLAMVTLSPPWAIIGADAYADPSLRWDFLFGEYDPENDLLLETLPYAGLSSQVFALIEWEDPMCEEENYRGSIASSVPVAYDTISSPSEDQFVVRCAGRWNIEIDEDGNETGRCTSAHREATVVALEHAYEAYISLGFPEPRLKKKGITSFKGYKYQLRQGDHNGLYNGVTKNAYTQYPGYDETPRCRTAYHELFHAVQAAYPGVFWNIRYSLWACFEGTARAAEMSLADEITRSSSSVPLNIDHPLFANDKGGWGLGTVTTLDYQHQDFWVYVGKKMSPDDTKLNFLIPLFQKGFKKEHVREFFSEDNTFLSLEDAYWQWAKNHSFEKEINICKDGAVPSGFPGSWSGHGNVRLIRYDPVDSVIYRWLDLTFGPQITSPFRETTIDDILDDSLEFYSMIASPGWYDSGETYKFNLSKYASRVIHITLDPGEEDHYEAVVSVEYQGSDGSWSPIHWSTAANYKFYNNPCRDINYCRSENRENIPRVVRVYDDAESLYLLVSNISSDARFRVTVDTKVIQPPKTLTIESTGVTEAIVKTCVTKEDGSQATMTQPTDYIIRDLRDSTVVGLKAYDYSISQKPGNPGKRQQIEFSHWSGAVESNDRMVLFLIDEDATVIAHYNVIEDAPEIEPPVAAEPPPLEIEDLPPLPSLIDYRLTVNTPPLLHLTRERDFTGVDIYSETGHGGKTNYTLPTIRDGTQVHLKAPVNIGTGAERFRFERWSGAVESETREIIFNMDGDKTVTAHYIADPEVIKEPDDPVEPPANYTLWVSSSADDPSRKIGVDITSKTGHGGKTPYTITGIKQGTEVHLEAPEGDEKIGNFSNWSGAISNTNRSINIIMDADKKVSANYWLDLF